MNVQAPSRCRRRSRSLRSDCDACAFSQGTLRIGMTAADIPLTTGQPDQGFEGFRFAGYTIYDALVNWDLSKADTIADIRPGLALSWAPVEVSRPSGCSSCARASVP